MVAASGRHGAAMAAKWRLVSMTQSDRAEFFSIEARVNVPIRPSEEKAKVVSCVFGSFCVRECGAVEIPVVARRR